MPRKLRFYMTKNYERKKAMPFKISIPLHNVTVLAVSIPLHLIEVHQASVLTSQTRAQVSDLQLEDLSSQLSEELLPMGWTKHIDANGLTIANLIIDSPLHASACFIVQFSHDLNWSISYRGFQVEVAQCPAIATIPKQITCISNAMRLISILHTSNICYGNPVEDFKSLVEEHKGEFTDTTGTCTLCDLICTCIHCHSTSL